MRQDPFVTLFSFICSQNNNINRITQMVRCMNDDFGTEIAVYNDKKYFSFPDLNVISKIKEKQLKEKKFGYRCNKKKKKNSFTFKFFFFNIFFLFIF